MPVTVSGQWLNQYVAPQLLKELRDYREGVIDILRAAPITFQRNGAGFANNTFALNQSGAATINFPSPDWNAISGTVGFIANKPTIPTVNYPVTSVNTRTGAVTGLLDVDQTNGTLRRMYDVASFRSGSSGLVGTIKITLPVSWTNTMMNIEIDGYDYGQTGAWKLILGGYNYAGGTTPATVATGYWNNYNAILITSAGSPRFNKVRFAHDGTRCCILLGVTTTSWQYPAIHISKVETSHSNTLPRDGWTITQITDETGIIKIAEPTLVNYRNIDASWIGSGILPIARGGTGGATASAARTNLGITPENISAVRVFGRDAKLTNITDTNAIALYGQGNSNTLGLPFGATTGVLTMVTGAEVAQLAMQTTNNIGEPRAAIRRNAEGSWRELWHSGNLNPVTINTAQTITGAKTFSTVLRANSGIRYEGADTYFRLNSHVPFAFMNEASGSQRACFNAIGVGTTYQTMIDSLMPAGGIYSGGNIRVASRLLIGNNGYITPFDTNSRRSGMYGIYNSSRIAHIWGMGTAYTIADDGSNFGNFYGFAYQYSTIERAIGHQAVWVQNGIPYCAIGNNFWTSGQFRSGVAQGTAPLVVESTTQVDKLNADMVDGLHAATGRNNLANQLVRTDASGYIQAGWINTTSGAWAVSSPNDNDKYYCSNDDYIRFRTRENYLNGLFNRNLTTGIRYVFGLPSSGWNAGYASVDDLKTAMNVPVPADLASQQAVSGQTARNGVATSYARSDHYHALPDTMPFSQIHVESMPNAFGSQAGWFRLATIVGRTNSTIYFDFSFRNNVCQFKLDVSAISSDLASGDMAADIILSGVSYFNTMSNLPPIIQRVRLVYLRDRRTTNQEFTAAIDVFKRLANDNDATLLRYRAYAIGNLLMDFVQPTSGRFVSMGGTSADPPPVQTGYISKMLMVQPGISSSSGFSTE